MSTPSPAPFNIFLDSDGVIADFGKALQESGLEADEFKHLPGVYLYLDVVLGAETLLKGLKAGDDENEFRVWVLTKTPSSSPYAYTEKVLWYRQHFPWLEDRVILTHDKSLLGTERDILVDDRPYKANADKFRGSFVLFEEARPIQSWEKVITVLDDHIFRYPKWSL